MTRRDRRSARIALAMLPVGGTLTVVSAASGVAVLLLAVDTVLRQPPGTGWWLAWSAAAAFVAWHNLRRAIEVMSAFDWRPVPAILAWSAATVAGYPGWWLG